tara:strand:- start:2797 stop:3354 length:558 start_codon:yes stop_codon:yes gene_type:complete
MKNFRVNVGLPPIEDIDTSDSDLNLFDQSNPDLNLFNLVDDEMIKLSGSKMKFFKYLQVNNHDEVYMEAREKPIVKEAVVVHGHYTPEAMQENLTQFGIELTNDQVFTFNKSYIQQKIGRSVIPGDIIEPFFQNQKYEIFEVVEDSFESYGVYHLVCNARLLRDSTVVQDKPMLNTSDKLGGYAD